MEQGVVNNFPCTNCGLCCKTIGALLKTPQEHPIIQQWVDMFPYKTDELGTCEQLDENNRCKVYDQRPLLCNVKLAGLLLNIDPHVWFEYNIQACNKLINDAGLGKEYLVAHESAKAK